MLTRRRAIDLAGLDEAEVIALIAAQRGLTLDAARLLYRRGESRRMDEERAALARRARAGNPVFKPRNDFTGTPRRA